MREMLQGTAAITGMGLSDSVALITDGTIQRRNAGDPASGTYITGSNGGRPLVCCT